MRICIYEAGAIGGYARRSGSPTDRDGGARVLRRLPRPVLSRNSARCPRSRDRCRQGRHPAARPLLASAKSIGDPADIETLADILVKAERPVILLGSQVWTVRGHQAAIDLVRALDIPAYFNGAARGLLPPGDPHHFDRTRREGFDKADVIVIVGTPFDFRMGDGKSAVINIWVDPREYAQGAKAQTMYK
jgi:thiamine pyrophosphate-dependent acetolactate synthase large subunit-like protein